MITSKECETKLSAYEQIIAAYSNSDIEAQRLYAEHLTEMREYYIEEKERADIREQGKEEAPAVSRTAYNVWRYNPRRRKK